MECSEGEGASRLRDEVGGVGVVLGMARDKRIAPRGLRLLCNLFALFPLDSLDVLIHLFPYTIGGPFCAVTRGTA